MLQNLRRAAVSLIGVTLAFGVYVLVVVPFVERQSDTSKSTKSVISQAVANIASTSTDRFVHELNDLGFRKDAWELQRPTVLRTPEATILLKDSKRLADGSLQIYPCTLIYYGAGRDAEKAERGPIIMQAPEGAILAFDRPINLQKLELDGKITGGRLPGDIRIFSSGGADSDDLEIVTRDVQISEKRIYTRERVVFRLGNSYGSGREMTLTRDESSESRRRPDGSVSGKDPELVDQLGLVELLHLEQLQLQLKDDSLFRAFTNNPSTTSEARPMQRAQGIADRGEEAKQPVAVKLTCRGPLRFDLKRQIATVENNVVISHQVPQQPENTLQADQLSLHFAQQPQDSRKAKGKNDSKLALNRIVGYGRPMLINASSESAYVETKHFEYNFDSNRIKLRAYNPFAPDAEPNTNDRVIIRNADHQIAAPAIDCLVAKDRAKTQLVAQGAGEYVGRISSSQLTSSQLSPATNETGTTVSATWSHRLSLQPFEGQQVLKVEGNATVRSNEFGEILADNLDLWLKQKQVATRIDGKPVFETTPTRLDTYSPSKRPIQITSSQVTGTLKSLTLHFVELPRGTGKSSKRLDSGFSDSLNPMSGLGRNTKNQPERPPSSYRVDGGDVVAWLDLANQQVQRLQVQGQTRLLETTPGNPNPMELKGTSIDARVDSQGKPQVKLAGEPAELKSPQMELVGNEIELRGNENRLSVPGGGKLRVEIDANAMAGMLGTPAVTRRNVLDAFPRQPEKAKVPQQIEVRWTDELRFDGQTAMLFGEVTMLGDDMAVRTNDLELQFQDRMDLANLDRKTTPKLAKATATQPVMAGTRQRDDAGKVESYQQVVTQDLTVDFQSGDLLANGPGWIAITATPDKLPSSFGGSPASSPVKSTAQTDSQSSGLRQLSLTFAQQLRGNLLQRNLGMFDNIQGWIGPVTRWEERIDPTEVTDLGEEQYRLSCNHLSIFESPTAGPIDALDPKSRKPFEMIAEQGAHVESQLYFARGERITFVEEKSVLTMRGSNERMAEFWQRNSPNERGALSGKARVIQYNVETGNMDARVSDVEIDLTEATRNRKRVAGIASR